MTTQTLDTMCLRSPTEPDPIPMVGQTWEVPDWSYDPGFYGRFIITGFDRSIRQANVESSTGPSTVDILAFYTLSLDFVEGPVSDGYQPRDAKDVDVIRALDEFLRGPSNV